jgi:hypothetical protein
MRTWVKVTFSALGVIALCFIALGATAAYFVMRNMEKKTATDVESQREVDVVRARFSGRTPLIEVIDPRVGDIRINRPQTADGREVSTVHIIAWKAEDREMTRAEVPLWLMQFSTINLLSRLGVAPERVRLTVDDVKRYGPGIVVDYAAPGKDRVLVWVD